MGMYTELHFNAELNRDIVPGIIKILKHMMSEFHHLPEPAILLPDIELFQGNGWCYMMQCDSYYFRADTHSTLRFDDIGNAYILCIRCNLKNYGNEIENFIDWIDPHLYAEPGDFLGFHRYEEDETPTLIHKK